MASSKLGDPFYFMPEHERIRPNPTEVAVFTYERWMWTKCPIGDLPSSWARWAEWETNQKELITWYSSLTESERREFTPWFTDHGEYDYNDYRTVIWAGWIHMGYGFKYQLIPRADSFFKYAKGPISPERDRELSLLNEQYPFIGEFNPRDDRWFWLAFRAAESFAFIREKTQGNVSGIRVDRRRMDDRKAYFPIAPNPEILQRHGVGWLRYLFGSPTKAIEWYCSISEDERQSLTPSYSSEMSTEPLTLFYDQGQAKYEVLDASDPRYLNAFQWW